MIARPQTGQVPADSRDRVARWAEGQVAVRSVILFGSRARGDFGPDSDWAIAVLFDGDRSCLSGLPQVLDGCPVDWIPIRRWRALRQRNVCSVSHAVATAGLCLHGNPLPLPERNGINTLAGWDNLCQSGNCLVTALSALSHYWTRPAHGRWGYEPQVAVNSAWAGELLCKCVLHMRGVEPRRSHSVEELCRALESKRANDSLLPWLRSCHGQTSAAHLDRYQDHMREGIGTSGLRLGHALHAFPPVLARATRVSDRPASERWVDQLQVLGDSLLASECPSEILRHVDAGLGEALRGLEESLNVAGETWCAPRAHSRHGFTVHFHSC